MQTSLIKLLSQDDIERILIGFVPLLSRPLLVIDDHSQTIARVGLVESRCEESLSLLTDNIRCTHKASCPHPGELASAPIELYGERLGLVVGCGDARTAQTVSFIAELISQRAKDEFELDSLSAEVLDKYEEINLLYEISGALGGILDTELICKLVLEEAVRIIEVERASLMLLDENEKTLYIVAQVGLPQGIPRAVRLGEGICGRVAQSGKPLLLDNIQDLPPDWRGKNRKYKANAFVCVPLVCSTPQTEEKVLGVINMADKASGQTFTSGDLKLLTAIASQAALAIHKSYLVEELRQAERIERELEIARRIQTSLLPGDPPQIEGLELAGRCVPASEVGGDYYDFFLSDGALGLLIADVSGHSIGPALMMAITRSVLRLEIARGKSPAEVLAATNSSLYNDLTQAELLITIFYANYNYKTRTLTYANAGHNLSFVWHASESKRTPLESEGALIGIWENAPYEQRAIALHPGDILMIYTDGVIEARNGAGERFGEERLLRVLRTNDHLTAQELLEEIYQQVRQFSGDLAQRDDITIVIMKVLD